MRYTVLTAVGSKLRVVGSSNNRQEAQKLMYAQGGVSVVRAASGRILASTVSRSFG